MNQDRFKIESTSHSITPRRTIVINQSLATSASFTVNMLPHNIHFNPRHIILRQLIYCNIGAGADNGTFLLWCSITNNHIGAVNMGIQANGFFPQTTIPLTSSCPNYIDFRLDKGDASFTGPTGLITMVLEFTD